MKDLVHSNFATADLESKPGNITPFPVLTDKVSVEAYHPQGYTRKFWTHPTSLVHCFTSETKKLKFWIHPTSLFSLITPGTQRLTHPLGRHGKHTNNLAATSDSWMVRCSASAWWFSWGNLHNKTSCSPSVLNTNFMTARELQIIPLRELNTDLPIGGPHL